MQKMSDINFETFNKSYDKLIVLDLRVIDCIRICSLLCDVSMGILPSYHLEESRVNYYKSLAQKLNDVVCGVCTNGQEN